jgi:hypothetical protein
MVASVSRLVRNVGYVTVPSPVQILADECTAFPEKSGVSFRFVWADVVGHMLMNINAYWLDRSKLKIVCTKWLDEVWNLVLWPVRQEINLASVMSRTRCSISEFVAACFYTYKMNNYQKIAVDWYLR